jgi:hypothetical protein
LISAFKDAGDDYYLLDKTHSCPKKRKICHPYFNSAKRDSIFNQILFICNCVCPPLQQAIFGCWPAEENLEDKENTITTEHFWPYNTSIRQNVFSRTIEDKQKNIVRVLTLDSPGDNTF